MGAYASRVEPELEDAPLTDSEILQFGPCVEAQTWTPCWIQEARAPIAVTVGKPKLGPVFNSDGVGKAVVIRPCVSRGRRVRGLSPIYTPQMLEAHAGVFSGWPMFMDHLPPELIATLAKHGRSVKDIGGQVLSTRWDPTFVHEDDARYGYRKGAVLAEVWATPLIRRTVGENPNLLHTSINAWPTSGKPGPVPWRPAIKGMVIEGIRSQPQGSVDYVVRGGAGGRLLLAEGVEEEGGWPEVGEWCEEDRRFVVSVAESLYASRHMSTVQLPSKPDELRDWLAENAPHLLPALAEADSEPDADDTPAGKRKRRKNDASDSAMTEQEIQQLVKDAIAEANGNVPTVQEFESRIQERTEQMLAEREAHRRLSERAFALIESAEGVPSKWKADLKLRYAVLPTGASPALLVEGEVTDAENNVLSEEQVIDLRVTEDLEHVRELIREAQGKPRVTGEGGAAKGSGGDGNGTTRDQTAYRSRLASVLGESEEDTLAIYGVPKSEKAEA